MVYRCETLEALASQSGSSSRATASLQAANAIVAKADDELEPHWPLYRQVGRFGALEDAVDVATRFFCHLALQLIRLPFPMNS